MSLQAKKAEAKLTNGDKSNRKPLHRKGNDQRWEMMFANDMSNKRLIAKIYKELIQFCIKNKQPDL